MSESKKTEIAFVEAANLLSHFYSQVVNQQKLAFEAGQRHGLEKLKAWILTHRQQEKKITEADVVAYLQEELKYDMPHSQQGSAAASMVEDGISFRDSEMEIN